MQEKELRLALVCFGGASLAVYMNGIVAEFLNGVRASAYRDQPLRLDPNRPLKPSALLYAKLLDQLSAKTRLSVIIDTIAGSSAGGLNGIFLGRAIAHDLSLQPLRQMWLELGDIEELMKGYSLAGRFSKVYFQPVLELLTRRIRDYDQFDEETKTKLMRFLRSRWFKPPFSGETMLTWMIDAALSMGTSRSLSANRDHTSLMPTGHSLDLFVRLTNFDGEIRSLTLDDVKAEIIQEKAYGKHMHFRYLRRLSGDGLTDFHNDNVPALGFAARATSSYPGAFQPVTLRDVDRHLRRRGLTWPYRETFLRHNFADQLARPAGSEELQAMNFMDGGIVDNKPFADAIAAIRTKVAQRPVDRRILFLEPMPTVDIHRSVPKPPGFFEMIFGAAFRIPISQPIYTELARVAAHNEARDKEEAIITAIRGDVAELVAELFTKEDMLNGGLKEQLAFQADFLAKGREQGADLAYNRSGFAVGAYHHARLSDTLDQLSGLVHAVLSEGSRRVARSRVSAAVVEWAQAHGLLSDRSLRLDAGTRLQKLLDFLKETDVRFRLRRMRRVVRSVNEIASDHALSPEISDAQFRKLKRRVHIGLDQAQQRLERVAQTSGLLDGLSIDPKNICTTELNTLIERLQRVLKLNALDEEADTYLAMVLNQLENSDTQLVLFRSYVGFSFEDMMTFTNKRVAADEDHSRVRVMRVSPVDSKALSEGENPLLGRRLSGFGAFFSRTSRENDFLWGRLHGADRLLDVIFDSVGQDNLPDNLEIKQVKREIFLAILEEEAPILTRLSDQISLLRQRFSEV